MSFIASNSLQVSSQLFPRYRDGNTKAKKDIMNAIINSGLTADERVEILSHMINNRDVFDDDALERVFASIETEPDIDSQQRLVSILKNEPFNPYSNLNSLERLFEKRILGTKAKQMAIVVFLATSQEPDNKCEDLIFDNLVLYNEQSTSSNNNKSFILGAIRAKPSLLQNQSFHLRLNSRKNSCFSYGNFKIIENSMSHRSFFGLSYIKTTDSEGTLNHHFNTVVDKKNIQLTISEDDLQEAGLRIDLEKNKIISNTQRQLFGWGWEKRKSIPDMRGIFAKNSDREAPLSPNETYKISAQSLQRCLSM